ncbi:MAG TPA: hypothetical protein VLC53_01415, partial [Myxococcota bacterium]|nr:hypothetical protein [Myxococcota bacterium]
MMQRAAAAWLVLAALALGACSSGTLVKLAYANAALAYARLDSTLQWTVEDYVPLRASQEAWVRERVGRIAR